MKRRYSVHVSGPILTFKQQGANQSLFLVEADFSKANYQSGDFEELGISSASGNYNRATGRLGLTIKTKQGNIHASAIADDRFAIISMDVKQQLKIDSPAGTVSIETIGTTTEGGSGSAQIITFLCVEMIVTVHFN